MKIYQVLINNEAEKKIDQIYFHILKVFQSEQSAKKTILKIFTAINSLDYFPYRYPKRNYPNGNNQERQYSLKTYKIRYQVDDSNNCVFVVKIEYGSRNYDA